jgi:hypothetical protein
MFNWVMHRRGVLCGVALAGAVALAGCGGAGGASGNKVASLSGNQNVTTTTLSKTDLETAALNYAKCMRAHGVNIPDPQFDSNGRPIFNRGGSGTGGTGSTNGGQGGGRGFFFGPGDRNGEANPQNSTFQKARQACQKYADAFRSAFQLNPQQQAQLQKNLLAFAKCMRENGVDFPDPTFDSNGRPQFGAGGNSSLRQTLQSAVGQKALQTCRSKVGGTGGPGGGGFFFGGRGGRGGTGGAGGTGSSSGATATP